MKKILRRFLPRTLRNFLHRIEYFAAKNDSYAAYDKNERKVLITLAADYGNLGDVAITYAQKKFLQDKFPQHRIITVPISRTFKDIRSLRTTMSSNDIVTIIGGGNMGNLYPAIEDQRQFLLKAFSKNKVISFPQSVYFTNDAMGEKFLKRWRQVYTRHNSLILFLREKKSFQLVKGNHVTSFLTPDIVLYLDETKEDTKRVKDRVIFCIRKDIESNISDSQKAVLEKFLTNANKKVEYYDTHLGDVTLNVKQGERALKDIWSAFRSSGLVITDRLHGMIFCAITQTPCIAIDNNNGKVRGVYDQWLKKANYLSLIDAFNMEEIESEMERLANLKPQKMTKLNLSKEFDVLKEAIE